MTSSSLSVLSSRGPDGGLTGALAAPPDHIEISANLSGLSDTTVGAVFVASGGAGEGSSSVPEGLTADGISGGNGSASGGGLAGTSGEKGEGGEG